MKEVFPDTVTKNLKNQMTKQTIYFNKIYVIESLNASETQTGTNLYRDLLRVKTQEMDDFSSELIRITDKKSFVAVMDNIAKSTDPISSRPYLHFEIHGSKNGLVLSSLELLSWEELYDHFKRINSFLKNQLFISLATCYGGYLFNAIDPTKRSPFYGFVGSTNPLTSNDIEVGFWEYFDILLEKFDLDEAIDALNRSNPELSTPYISIVSEAIFKIVSDKLNAQTKSRQFQLAKIKELVKRAMADPNIRGRYSKAELQIKMKDKLKRRSNDLKILEEYFLFKRDSAAI